MDAIARTLQGGDGMRVPICIFCKYCERMSLKNRRVTFISRCTKHNTVVVSTTKECGDYDEDGERVTDGRD